MLNKQAGAGGMRRCRRENGRGASRRKPAAAGGRGGGNRVDPTAFLQKKEVLSPRLVLGQEENKNHQVLLPIFADGDAGNAGDVRQQQGEENRANAKNGWKKEGKKRKRKKR
ncbi:hypothetical protein SLEP1_g12600 [Rubroshorea leprosula]|uniref:Uncharacterized protein n=1 Tax=Rubroshorea leprosula TaxID=152421 RepID=A0AAV5ID22_9ROSI|nr:hypothetical protein SLEP1_g12600 [Rubroshorea leprosula]